MESRKSAALPLASSCKWEFAFPQVKWVPERKSFCLWHTYLGVNSIELGGSSPSTRIGSGCMLSLFSLLI